MRRVFQLAAVAVVLLAIPAGRAHVALPVDETLVAPIAHAQTPDAADIAEGMRLYLQKGDCQACHGWAADGRKMDSQMPDGSNLRETRLDRARLDHDDQVRTAGNRHAGLRQVRLQRRPLLRHEAGRSQIADARSAGDVPAARGRSRRRLPAARRSSAKARWIAPSASSTGARRSRPAGSSEIEGRKRRRSEIERRDSYLIYPTPYPYLPDPPSVQTRTRTDSSSSPACRTSRDAGGVRRTAPRDTASVRSRRSPARP